MTYRTKDLAHLAAKNPKVWGQIMRHGRWSNHNTIVTLPDDFDTTSLPSRGLGDFVAKIAQPIARAIDHFTRFLFGPSKATKVQKCVRCKKTQKKLNAALPFQPPIPPPS